MTRLASYYAESVNFWNSSKNDNIDFHDVTLGMKKKFWWVCEEGHEWESKPVAWKKVNKGCPVCMGQIRVEGFNDVFTLYPELKKYWHPTKNEGISPEQIKPNNENYWWICDEGHEHKTQVRYKVRGNRYSGCKYCSGQAVKKGYNSLSDLFPEIAAEWDYEKNNLTPDEVHPGSNIVRYWVCREYGHSWKSRISERTTRFKSGCKVCSLMRMPDGSTALSEAYPDVASEWDYELNFPLTPDTVAQYANREAWWKCDKGHTWKAVIANRTRHGSKCAVCWRSAKLSVAEQEILSLLDALEVEYVRNPRLLPGGKELDVYIPAKHLAIEYNGIYWHSERAGKTPSYHEDKVTDSKALGIRTLMVWEDEYASHKKAVIKHILTALDKLPVAPVLGIGFSENDVTRVHASTGIITSIEKEEASAFFEENFYRSNPELDAEHYGLVIHDDVKAVLSVTAEDEGTISIAQYVESCEVVKGFAAFVAFLSLHCPESRRLSVHADRGMEIGDIYQGVGFQFTRQLPADYSYYDSKYGRENKASYSLERFKSDDSLEYHEGMGIMELADLNGLNRVWDSGWDEYVKLLR